MGKLIFTVVVIWAIYYFFFKEKKPLKQKKESENKDLIMCDKCKTFVSEDEIIKVNGKNICKECYDNLK